MRVKVEKLVYGGWGLGRVEGRVVLLPRVLPGEEWEVEVVKERKDYLVALPNEAVSLSEDRIDPPCPHFSHCGGCDYQHIPYGLQVKFKEEILKEELRRIGGIGPEAVEPMVPAGRPLGWRLRVDMAVAVTDRVRLGFFRRGSREVVDVEVCPIAHDLIGEILQGLRPALERHLGFSRALRRVEVAVSPQEGKGHLILYCLVHHDRRHARALAEELATASKVVKDVLLKHRAFVYPRSLLGKGRTESALKFRLKGREVLRYPGVFFQANWEQNERLAAILQETLRDGVGEVLELFSGMGNLSLPLAPLASSWTGVERDQAAVRNANYNLQLNGVRNVKFIQGEALKVLEDLLPQGQRYELLLLDPPREGALSELRAALGFAPKRIVYVSCNPATLARDLKFLVGEGFQLKRVIPLDFFPQTHHIEAVAFLERTNPWRTSRQAGS